MTKEEFTERLTALKARYPYMFVDGKTSIELPIGGWMPLFRDLCEAVHEELTDDLHQHFHWTQVKEKLGGLRAYRAGGPTYVDILGMGTFTMEPEKRLPMPEEVRNRIQALVRQAEAASVTICQWCSAPGERQQKDGYICTACARCINDPAIWER